MSDSFEVSVSDIAAASIQAEAEARWPFETGGVLLGSRTLVGITVEVATGPGPNARHGLACFTRDGEYAQKELERIHGETNGVVDYVGEWHSHTLPIGPSSRDRNSIANIAASVRYALSDPILILGVPTKLIRKREWQVRVYRFVLGELVECPV